MRTLGMAALLTFMLMLTLTSTGHAQSAEDLAKGQSSGVSYYSIMKNEYGDVKFRYRIRGDELTWTQEGQGIPENKCGGPWRIINKHTEGNKVILEIENHTKYIIDGFRFVNANGEGGSYTRE